MVDRARPALRPMRLPGAVDRREPDSPVPPVPEHVPERPLAPDWRGATEDNGLDQPRGVLHVALLAPNEHVAAEWRQRARIVVPPLWKGGKVTLHVVTVDDEAPSLNEQLLFALVDLGLLDSADAGLVGYPSALEKK